MKVRKVGSTQVMESPTRMLIHLKCGHNVTVIGKLNPTPKEYACHECMDKWSQKERLKHFR